LNLIKRKAEFLFNDSGIKIYKVFTTNEQAINSDIKERVLRRAKRMKTRMKRRVKKRKHIKRSRSKSKTRRTVHAGRVRTTTAS